jgi:hypothetical protein
MEDSTPLTRTSDAPDDVNHGSSVQKPEKGRNRLLIATLQADEGAVNSERASLLEEHPQSTRACCRLSAATPWFRFAMLGMLVRTYMRCIFPTAQNCGLRAFVIAGYVSVLRLFFV